MESAIFFYVLRGSVKKLQYKCKNMALVTEFGQGWDSEPPQVPLLPTVSYK